MQSAIRSTQQLYTSVVTQPAQIESQPESDAKCVLHPILQNATFDNCTTSLDNEDLAVGL